MLCTSNRLVLTKGRWLFLIIYYQLCILLALDILARITITITITTYVHTQLCTELLSKVILILIVLLIYDCYTFLILISDTFSRLALEVDGFSSASCNVANNNRRSEGMSFSSWVDALQNIIENKSQIGGEVIQYSVLRNVSGSERVRCSRSLDTLLFSSPKRSHSMINRI